MTLHTIAADIAQRIPEMAKDSVVNNAELIERLISQYDAVASAISQAHGNTELLTAKPAPAPPSCTVRVMRSHDYCHFEISLTTEVPGVQYWGFQDIEFVDEVRKDAARLADKAVAQYKVAKNNFDLVGYDRAKAGSALKIPEAERTPEQQALAKVANNDVYWANRTYDYQDDWED